MYWAVIFPRSQQMESPCSYNKKSPAARGSGALGGVMSRQGNSVVIAVGC